MGVDSLSPEKRTLLARQLQMRGAAFNIFPLSFAQERLWFLEQIQPGSPSYNIPTAVRLRGTLRPALLAQVLGEVMRRHEALRTTFLDLNGRAVQRVLPAAPARLPMLDLGALPPAIREQAAAEFASVEACRPFDLAHGPLLRSTLLRIAAEEHILLLTLHHIVADGWSIGVLVREVSVLYTAFGAGRPSPLSELPIQVPDFAHWQRGRLGGEVLERQLAWWKERLAGLPVLELPTDHPRPAVRSLHGRRDLFTLEGELTRRLRDLGRRRGATLFMTLLTAFQALLARHAGQDDVVVGSPIANRNRREIEPLIGVFVNTLVLRTDLAGDPSFANALERVQETCLGAFAHQDLPFEKLVEELQPQRDMGRNPLFQVMVAVENAPLSSLELPGLTATPLTAHTHTSKFDLHLDVWERQSVLECVLEYATDLFDPPTMARLAGQFRRVLEQAAVDPELRLSALSLLTAAERHQILREWNDTGRDYPREATLAELFAEQAALHPDAPALSAADGELTYGELDRWANRLARQLRHQGVGTDSLVGICAERSLDLIVGLLGILKAGGAYVPLDPEYPQERLALLIEDTAASVLLVQDRLAACLPAGGHQVSLSAAGAAGSRADEAPLPAAATAESLAYVMYTSGSTGRPKGVAVSHRAVVRLVRETGYARFGSGEVFLQLAPVSFDASTLEIWGPLLNGGRLVLMPPGRASLEDVEAVLERHGVTTLWLTSALFQQMVDDHTSGLRPVRQLLAGGDVLPVRQVRRALQELPGTTLINGYGPTENTTFTCCRPMTDASRVGPGPVPIGRPIGHTIVRILDRHLAPVPVGVHGELCAGGDGLARGYLNRPDLTAERFVPDPCSEGFGARLYRTGDRARFLPDGEVEFLGRLDEQVKVRGFRVEPGEVEAALAAQPGVREAAVVAHAEPGGGRRLVAYLALDRQEDAAREDVQRRQDRILDATAPRLRRALREQLPDPMVPSVFVILETLPLTPNGKVDRRALAQRDPALEPARPLEGQGQAPRTPVEETLCAIWAEMLGSERVGRDDDFFELGGHSLLATQAISRVRAALRVELPLQALFEHPTAAALAEAVEEARGHAGGAAPPPLRRAPREGSIPLSFAQERLWFLHQLQPDDPSYNEPILARLNGRLDVAALARAFTEVARRHEVLRTVFPEVEGRPVQVVLPAAPVPLPVVDLEELPATARRAEVRRLGLASLRAPFDLSRGPLVRLLLARHGGTEHELLLVLHHIVFDGWSTGILVRALAALYAGSVLPEPRIQYADFALWQRQGLQSTFAAQLSWWRERLAGMTTLELPTDRARPAVESHRGATCPIALPATLTASLRSVGQHRRATSFMTLLAAFQALLHRLTGQDDVVVGSPIAGRNRAEIEELVGFFVNMLILRTDCGGDPGFLELVDRVREVTLGAYDHQDLPFEKLVAELRPGRDLSANPLFQVAFQVFVAPRSEVRLPGLTLDLPRLETGTAKFDLSLHLVESGDGLAGWLEYGVDLFEETTARRLLGCFRNVLEEVASDPSRRLSELALLSPQERHQVLVELQAPEASSGPALLHSFFEIWADRAPGSTAVAWRNEVVTYGELEERANHLAARLRERGAGPETKVAVCLERSPDLIAALLAVLKSDAAYVPIDPAYPAERSRFMLQDSGALFLITRSVQASALGVPEEMTVLLDGAKAAPQALRPVPRARCSNLAYVIYTSGSTGRPKGVAVEHRSAAALLRWAWQAFPGDALQAVAACTSVCFDLSVFEIFAPLSRGGRVILVDDALDLPASPAASGATLVNTVPSAARELVRLDGLPPRVATVCLAGEPLPRSLVDRLLERPSVERVLNLYGPSEDTTYSTFAVLSRRGPADASAPAIGCPVAGTRLRLLDRYGRPTPLGVPGEIHLGGAGLARGYLGRPELTAERFVPDPFSQEPGERLYRTGDLGRLRPPDGQVEFLGRRDQQVKLRGHRIELGEIEAALARHPDVEEAAVVAAEGPGGLELVSWLVPRRDHRAPSALEVRRFLREILPEPMIPAAVAGLDELPRTPNGKLDRRALAERRARPAAELPDAAPRNLAEEVLAGIWREVLGVAACGINDDFFELGGHSLLATQVVSRVRDAFGFEVPLRQLFITPTIGGLAAAVSEALRVGAGLGVPPLARTPSHAPRVLSFGQERLWFLHRMDPGSAAYNMPLALRLEGRLAPAALERALGEVAHRHETLRTTFPDEGGRPAPLVTPAVDLPLRRVDLTSLGAAERDAEPRRQAEEEVRRRAEEEARRPFDLTRGPLARALLFRLAPEEHVLVLTVHHIVCDGWSLRLLLNETAAAYAALAAGRTPRLPDLPIQFTDFALWQRQWLCGEALAAQLAWWRQHLGGLPSPLDLPTDRPRPPVRSGRGRRLAFALPPELSAAARTLGQRHGGTLFMILLAAWATLLHRYTRREDVVVGSPIANRSRSETEGLIGFFANTLALRVDLAGRPSFRDLLARVREGALGAYTYQDLPFEKLVEELRPERNLAHTPIFQVMLVLHNATASAQREVSGLRLHPFTVDEGGEKFDLTLSLAEGSALTGSLSYSDDLFEEATMARLLGHFESLLAEAVRQPVQSVAGIPLLRCEERQQILQEWSGAAHQTAVVPELAGLFARALPGADAVIEGGHRLSHRWLDLQASRIAARLRELGVGPEVRVALCLERSSEMVAALLAVLRAGGAYVPLDPAWPAERLEWMLEDAGAEVLLASAALRERLPRFQGRVMDVAEALTGAETGEAPWSAAPAESLAYVLYTSGSTGRPKGVMVSRGALASYLAWAEDAYPVTEGRGSPVHSPLAFDLTVTSLLSPLAVGRAVVLVPEEARLDGLAASLREGGFSLVKLTPAHLEVLKGLLPPGSAGVFTRSLVVGGEALFWEQIPGWPGVRVFNEYGPTETVVGCCMREILPGEQGEGPVPIGRPTGNARLYLLDSEMQPMPAGVPGELWIGGLGVARGYLDRPDLTAERFLPDPWGPAGARLYRTGDLGRFLPDGEVQYLGRLDLQIKIRGFRLEPAEVEAALAVHPGVRSAVVGALGSGPQDQRLVAWVVPADGAPDELLAPALRAHLAERLPELMIPSQIVFLNELPLTANGKVDPRALPAPDGWSAVRTARVPYLAPRSDLERRIAEVWQRVLRVDRVGIDDSFFELGGHSLLVAQVQAGLRAALDVDLPLVELFRFPTVAQLAARVAPPPEPPSDALPAASVRAEKLREGRRRIEQRARLRRGEP